MLLVKPALNLSTDDKVFVANPRAWKNYGTFPASLCLSTLRIIDIRQVVSPPGRKFYTTTSYFYISWTVMFIEKGHFQIAHHTCLGRWGPFLGWYQSTCLLYLQVLQRFSFWLIRPTSIKMGCFTINVNPPRKSFPNQCKSPSSTSKPTRLIEEKLRIWVCHQKWITQRMKKLLSLF